jgi:hypothetical protein
MKILIFNTFLVLLILIFIIILSILSILSKKYYNIFYKKEYFSNNNLITDNKYCCFYAYYEKDNLYKNNFTYFLENGILDNIDYYIIINGESTIDISQKKNIKIFHRENKGFDFGAYSYAIKNITKEYDYYVFLNATVKGPYLTDNSKNWLYTFLSLFYDNVKLVGSSICYTPTNHNNLKSITDKDNIYYVQTPFFIIKQDFFKYINSKDFFNEDELNNITDLTYVIVNKEIKLSSLCYKFGGNINCYLSKYRNLDYTSLNYDINNSSFNGDPYFINTYFCNTIQPNDVIFYKNKRFLYDTITHKNVLDKHRLNIIDKVCNN